MLALVFHFAADIVTKLFHQVLAQIYVCDRFIVKNGKDLSAVVISYIVIAQGERSKTRKQLTRL